MPKLTKSFIDKVQPPASGYVIHWDEAVKGYGLRVMAGGKRSFVAQGRVNGKAVIHTIGAFGLFTEEQARKKAQKVLQDMREGVNPRDARKGQEAAVVTLRTVADEYFDRPNKLREGTRAEMDRHIKKVFGAWEHKPIAAITEEDVRRRYREMTTRGLTGKGPAVGSANLSMTTLRTLFNFAGRKYRRADGTPLIQHNPVAALKDDWIQLQPRTRDIEEKKVGAVLHKWNEERVKAPNRDAVAGFDLARFLLLTGARLMEGAALTWDRVNLEEGWFHLPDPKNKNPVWLPLSSQAVDLLKSRPRAKGADGEESPFVFPSRSRAGHILDARGPLELAGQVVGHRISAHDLRRSFVSIGVATLGIDLYRIELLTNHVPKGVTARHYLRTSRLQYLQPEVQRIGDWVEQQERVAAAKAGGANVVTLRA